MEGGAFVTDQNMAQPHPARLPALANTDTPVIDARHAGTANLVSIIEGYDPKADTGLIESAYVIAAQAHGTQRRDNGDPYITHPLAVARILADYHLDVASIATALLH